LEIHSLGDLYENEDEILRRLRSIRNGPQLFALNPLLLLHDLEVHLNDRARRDLIDLEPSLGGLSPGPYYALKRSSQPQKTDIRLRMLFRRRRP
jgi:hypothetical protein